MIKVPISDMSHVMDYFESISDAGTFLRAQQMVMDSTQVDKDGGAVVAFALWKTRMNGAIRLAPRPYRHLKRMAFINGWEME